MYSLTRRFVTLIEMMIVMFLIALITGVIAYNYRGSLDEGKIFKTHAGIDKLETILNLEVAKRPELAHDIRNQWEAVVKRSAIVKDPDSLIYDGWGEKYQVDVDNNGNIKVTSAHLDEMERGSKGSSRGR